MPMTLGKFHNILYFNLFRFNCFCQYWIALPMIALVKMIGLDSLMSRRHEREDWDDYLIEVLNNPNGGTSLFFTDRFMGILYCCVTFILWNLAGALLQLDFYTWKYGMYFWMAVGVLAVFVFNHEYVEDFREFKSWSENDDRKFAIITFLTVSGIFLALIGSFALYMSIVIGNK